MPLADTDTIQKYCFVRAKISDKAVEFQPSAEIKMREWISDDVYDALDPEAASGLRATQAESLLCMAEALPQLNMRFSELGGLTKSIGMPGDTSEEMMSLRELKLYAGELNTAAFHLIASLIPELDDDPDSFTSSGFGIIASTNYAEECDD